MPHTVHAAAVDHLPEAEARPDGLTLAAFAAVVVVGAGNAVAIKIGLQELPAYWGAALRFLAASLLLLAYTTLTRRPLPRGRALVGVLIYGALSFGGAYAFAYYALTEVTAGAAMVALSLVPLYTVLLAAAQGIETFRFGRLAGAAIAAAGIALVFADSLGTSSPAALAALVLGGLCIAQGTITIKRFPRVDSVVENGLAMGIGGLMLLALSYFAAEAWFVPQAPASLASLAYLSILGSIGVFGMYLFVVGRWTASGATYALLVMPLFTIMLGWLLLAERPSIAFAAGAVIALLGVWIGALAPHRRQPTP